MDPLLRVLLTNAAAAGVVSIAAWLASRAVRRPAIVHALWLVAVLRLLAPPLFSLPILPATKAGLAGAAGAPDGALQARRSVLGDVREATTAPAVRTQRPSTQERGEQRATQASPAEDAPRAARTARLAAGPDARVAVGADVARAVRAAALERLPAGELPWSALAPRPDGLPGSAILRAILIGAIGVVLLSAVRHVRFTRLLHCAAPAPTALVERTTTLAARMGMRRTPAVRVVDARVPPLVWLTPAGPQLLLPRDLLGELTGDERDALLVHELAHVRRRDHWVRLLEIAATALFWWYPLTWWMRRALRRAEERCCDEWVLRTLPGLAVAYASGLLKSATLVCDDPTPLPAGASGAGPVRELESRLKEILMTRPAPQAAKPVRLALATLAVAGLTVFPTRAASVSPGNVRPADGSAVVSTAAAPSAAETEMPGTATPAAAPARPEPAKAEPATAGAATAASPVLGTRAPRAESRASIDETRGAPAVAVAAAAPERAPVPEGAAPLPAPGGAVAEAPVVAATQGDEKGTPTKMRGAAAPPVVRISVERIQLDAVITDKRGRHVTDLASDEIEVFQDGRRQQVSDLVYVRVGARTPGAGAAPSATPRLAGATSPDAASPAPTAAPRTIVFVVDDLSLSPHGFDAMRRALRHTIARLDPADRVDVIGTGSTFASLAPTTDRAANLAALGALRRTPWTRTQLARLVMPEGGSSASVGERAQFRFDGGVMEDLDARLALFSITVVRHAVRALRDEPGRKALLLVSEGVAGLSALTPGHVPALTGPLDRAYGDVYDLNGALKRLAEFAGRSSVVIDAVDPRGLVSAGLNAEHSVNTHDGREFEAMTQGRHLALFKEQTTLQYLADRTGGLARLDTNDVTGAVASIIDDLSGYYLIGYEPAAGTFDGGGFKRVDVKVKRPGLKVRTREGFYPVTDEELWSVVP